jgi:hypothetical protein
MPQVYSVHNRYSNTKRISSELDVQRLQSVFVQVRKLGEIAFTK